MCFIISTSNYNTTQSQSIASGSIDRRPNPKIQQANILQTQTTSMSFETYHYQRNFFGSQELHHLLYLINFLWWKGYRHLIACLFVTMVPEKSSAKSSASWVGLGHLVASLGGYIGKMLVISTQPDPVEVFASSETMRVELDTHDYQRFMENEVSDYHRSDVDWNWSHGRVNSNSPCLTNKITEPDILSKCFHIIVFFVI